MNESRMGKRQLSPMVNPLIFGPMSRSFAHHHLLDIESLSAADINMVLDLTETYAKQNNSSNKKSDKLHGKTVVNLFFETSTRTRTSFEIAAKRLGADVINFSTDQSSINKKGETLLDTVMAIDAMKADALVMRHAESGIQKSLSGHLKASMINAGDGTNEHPTQALLDAFVIRKHKKKLEGLVVAICGDIAHSRVARSNIHLLRKLGAKVRIVAPSYFINKDFSGLGVETFDDLTAGITGADVVMMLRIQHERMGQGEFAVSLKDYHQRYGLDHKKLAAAKPDVIVMHPGPINREVELTSKLADDLKHSVILEQIEAGVAIRMAVLDLLLSRK